VLADQLASGFDGRRRVIYLSPAGRVLTQGVARELATGYDNLILLCGHYEGVDRRIVEEIADEEISIGDFVLTGGELPACVLVDCVARLTEGVLSDAACYEEESLSAGLLEYPQFTRPEEYHGMRVPDVLLSGDHARIRSWRQKAALELTKRQRPDLLERTDHPEEKKDT
jgi:tRNA (guanine37-N1)-methyltransferase